MPRAADARAGFDTVRAPAVPGVLAGLLATRSLLPGEMVDKRWAGAVLVGLKQGSHDECSENQCE